jgi:hypothetical protein
MSNQANYPTRRALVSLIPGALALSGCVTTQSQPRYTGPGYRVVEYQSGEKPGTIIVDPGNHFLYSVQDARQALQYEVGVGKEGYGWSDVATVHDKKEWPDWYPTADILQRKPKSDSIWSSCKAVSACTADPTIHSALGRCTSGRVTATRFIASTAPMNRTAALVGRWVAVVCDEKIKAQWQFTGFLAAE